MNEIENIRVSLIILFHSIKMTSYSFAELSLFIVASKQIRLIANTTDVKWNMVPATQRPSIESISFRHRVYYIYNVSRSDNESEADNTDSNGPAMADKNSDSHCQLRLNRKSHSIFAPKLCRKQYFSTFNASWQYDDGIIIHIASGLAANRIVHPCATRGTKQTV